MDLQSELPDELRRFLLKGLPAGFTLAATGHRRTAARASFRWNSTFDRV